MNATTQIPTRAPLPVLAETRVQEATLRRAGRIAASIVLITAGVLVGVHVPGLGAALLAAGLETCVVAITDGHDERRHPRRNRDDCALA